MKALKLIIAALLPIIMAGCTQNNGDITPWFGYWRMTELTINGNADPDYDGMITWSFQNDIVFINTYTEHHTYDDGVGTWRQSDNRLILNYTHAAGQGNNAYLYTPPAILQLPTDSEVAFDIVSLTGREAVLKRTLPSGAVMQCTLKKAY